MNSIYERVLGTDFHRLHPQIQRRFGFSSSDGIASIGRGVMDEIWKGRFVGQLHGVIAEQLQRVANGSKRRHKASTIALCVPLPLSASAR